MSLWCNDLYCSISQLVVAQRLIADSRFSKSVRAHPFVAAQQLTWTARYLCYGRSTPKEVRAMEMNVRAIPIAEASPEVRASYLRRVLGTTVFGLALAAVVGTA